MPMIDKPNLAAPGRDTVVACIAVAAIATSFMLPAHAQLAGPRNAPPVQLRATPPQPAANPARESLLDRVMAVVNDEAITQFEIDEGRRVAMVQMREQKVEPPAPDVLERQVLERLITERALMQFAKETGVRIDDTTVERAISRIASENKLTPDQFRLAVEREGIPYARYREDVRRELVIQRLREREVENRVQVSDAEVDNFLATLAVQQGDREYNLQHILVAVAEQSSPEQVAERRRRAEEALKAIQSGEDFATVAAGVSDAPDALKGASLGWRNAVRLPSVFAEVAQGLKKGEVSGVLRSPAGFHIMKVVDIRERGGPSVVDQTRVRHILVRVNETTSEFDGRARIDRVKDRIDNGAKFEDMARVNSEDASSARGGDLGWINAGDTVPDFERAMNLLKIGEVSGPIRSPFGWHLIRVDDRRQQDVSRDRAREQARLALRQRKSDEMFQEFVRQTRDRAYVELKLDG